MFNREWEWECETHKKCVINPPVRIPLREFERRNLHKPQVKHDERIIYGG